jgi:hypothetical protein
MVLNAMEDDLPERTCLTVLHQLLEADTAFYGTVRLLDGRQRTRLVTTHMRTTEMALGILRRLIDPPSPPRSIVITMDLSGNTMRGFLDSVPVTATPQQIASASDLNVITEPPETCPICRDPVQVATRLRACGHCFHADCITEWLGMNTRCPVCRHDIREPASQAAYGSRANPTQ